MSVINPERRPRLAPLACSLTYSWLMKKPVRAVVGEWREEEVEEERAALSADDKKILC